MDWSLWVSVCAVCGRFPPQFAETVVSQHMHPPDTHYHTHTHRVRSSSEENIFARKAMNFWSWWLGWKNASHWFGGFCASVHIYSVSWRFTLLSDLMAVSLLSNNTDPDWASSCYLHFLLCWLVCVCVHVLCARACAKVCECKLRAGAPSTGILPVILMKQHHSPPLKQLRLQLIGLHERRGVRWRRKMRETSDISSLPSPL